MQLGQAVVAAEKQLAWLTHPVAFCVLGLSCERQALVLCLCRTSEMEREHLGWATWTG